MDRQLCSLLWPGGSCRLRSISWKPSLQTSTIDHTISLLMQAWLKRFFVLVMLRPTPSRPIQASRSNLRHTRAPSASGASTIASYDYLICNSRAIHNFCHVYTHLTSLTVTWNNRWPGAILADRRNGTIIKIIWHQTFIFQFLLMSHGE